LTGCNLKDLSFLKDLNLESLTLARNPCTDLAALANLPLRRLNLRDTEVEDLSPLAVCWHLEEIVLPKKARVFEPLRSLTSLKRISRKELANGSPDLSAPDFWKEVQKEEPHGNAK
jgi:Leucine-rich repeat (LRR) protein